MHSHLPHTLQNPTRGRQNQDVQDLQQSLHQKSKLKQRHLLPWRQVQSRPAAPGDREALRQRGHALVPLPSLSSGR